jgi:hypothetical protein
MTFTVLNANIAKLPELAAVRVARSGIGQLV